MSADAKEFAVEDDSSFHALLFARLCQVRLLEFEAMAMSGVGAKLPRLPI
ncbi:hypothetical protein QE435_004928 [Rhizobium sp. SORGH_AS 787]|nr:hypothetical protein [Rhizobium sp. SORGH_AS_0787]